MRDSYASMALYVGERARVGCHTYPDDSESGPILFIDVPKVSLTISPANRRAVVAQDVARARALAEAVAVAVYLAQVERLAALNAEVTEDGTSKPGGSAAAA